MLRTTLKENWRLTIEILGIIAIVGSLFLVVEELQQTQRSLETAALSTSNERTSNHQRFFLENELYLVEEKITGGEELRFRESQAFVVWTAMRMRHYEVLHHQYRLGLTDEESWRADVTALESMVNGWWFDYRFPEWPQNTGVFRESFVELVTSLKK